MQLVTRFWQSSIGCKVVMAVTGILLFLFLVGHMAGNFLLFAGPAAMNDYAQTLKDLGPGLWIIRLGLLGVFALHILAAMRTTRLSREARPQQYEFQKPIQATYASSSMLMTGLIVLLYVIYHLLHFTIGAIQSDNHALRTADGRHDVYNMVVAGFQNPLVSLTYVAAMVLLAIHLSHGMSSVFQTLGFSNPKQRGLWDKAGPALAALIAGGFILIPVAVLLGFVEMHQGAA